MGGKINSKMVTLIEESTLLSTKSGCFKLMPLFHAAGTSINFAKFCLVQGDQKILSDFLQWWSTRKYLEA